MPPGSDERQIGIIPNGHTTYSDKNNLRYLRLIRKHSSIIQGQFFGHLHSDSFRIVYNDMGKASPFRYFLPFMFGPADCFVPFQFPLFCLFILLGDRWSVGVSTGPTLREHLKCRFFILSDYLIRNEEALWSWLDDCNFLVRIFSHFHFALFFSPLSPRLLKYSNRKTCELDHDRTVDNAEEDARRIKQPSHAIIQIRNRYRPSESKRNSVCIKY
jgi:hypothetical protein